MKNIGMITNRKHSIYLIVLITLISCNYRNNKESHERLKGSSWFQRIQTGILQPRCLGCHSAELALGGIDLSSYAKIMEKGLIVPFEPEQSKLFDSIKSGRMPKNGPQLSAIEMRSIYEWIIQGAGEFDESNPQTIPTPTPTPVPLPLKKPEPRFSWLLANTFQTHCLSCHSGQNPKGDVDFSTYKNLMNSEGMNMNPISPKSPLESGVYNQIKSGKMPPPPAKCSDEELKAIYDWIMAGAENN